MLGTNKQCLKIGNLHMVASRLKTPTSLPHPGGARTSSQLPSQTHLPDPPETDDVTVRCRLVYEYYKAIAVCRCLDYLQHDFSLRLRCFNKQRWLYASNGERERKRFYIGFRKYSLEATHPARQDCSLFRSKPYRLRLGNDWGKGFFGAVGMWVQ